MAPWIRLACSALSAILVLAGTLTAAQASLPEAFSFSGTLESGGIAFDGTADFTVRILDSDGTTTATTQCASSNAAGCGNGCLLEETFASTAVSAGRFSLMVGAGDTSLDGVFNGCERFLQILVQGSAIGILPIGAAPNAMRATSALQADTALNASSLGGVEAGKYVLSSAIPGLCIDDSELDTKLATYPLLTTLSTNIDGDVVINGIPVIDSTGAWIGTPTSTSSWDKSGDTISYDTGKVGIGTTLPDEQLSVDGTVGVSQDIVHSGDTDTLLRFQNNRTTMLMGNVEMLDAAGSGTQKYLTLGHASDVDTKIKGGSGSIFIQGSDGFIGINDATPSYPVDINATTSIAGDLFAIGKVGIGTSGPSTNLHVKGEGEVVTRIQATTQAALQLNSDAANGNPYTLASNAKGQFLLWDESDNTGRLLVEANGKVSVGGESAASTLHIKQQSDGWGGGLRLEKDADTNAWEMYADSNAWMQFAYNGAPPSLTLYNNEESNFNGKLGVNHPDPASTLHVRQVDPDWAVRIRTEESTNIISFEAKGAQSGYIVRNAASTATTYGSTSDVRVKEGIVDTTMGLETLERVQVRDFTFKADPSDLMQGYIAQELHEVYPHAVYVPDDPQKTWAVDHGRLTPLIISAVQELNAKVDAQAELIAQQQALIERLSARLDAER